MKDRWIDLLFSVECRKIQIVKQIEYQVDKEELKKCKK